jgi:hypothetical protein
MRSRILCVATLLAAAAAVLVPSPARAGLGAVTAIDVDVDVTVGLVGNLNDPAVVALGRADGRVRLRRPLDPAWTDLGTPADSTGRPLRATRLATSGGKVFAATADGVFAWSAPTTWTRIGDPVADLLASRDGAYIRRPNQPVDFQPYLYTVDAAGRVSRFTGQGWAVIGSGAGVGSLAEVGMTSFQLYKLDADRASIWRWGGSPGVWTHVGGASESIAGGPSRLARTDLGTGKVQFFDSVAGSWTALAVVPSPVPGPVGAGSLPLGRGGRWAWGVSDSYGATAYYLTGDGRVFGVRIPALVAPGAALRTTWIQLAAGNVRQLATQSGQRGKNDLFLMTGGGAVHTYTWPELWAYGDPRRPATQGQPYETVRPLLGSGAGNVRLEPYSGALPPGLTWSLRPDGRLAVYGTPAATGTFDFQLLATDDSGSTLVVDRSITVSPPAAGPVGPDIQAPLNAATSITVISCRPGPAPVWVRDLTIGAAFQPAPGSPAPAHTGGCVVPGPPGIRIAPVDEHLYEVVILDPGRELCAGRDDPTIAACVLTSLYFAVSAASGTPQTITVG